VDNGLGGRLCDPEEVGELPNEETARFRNGLLEPKLRLISEGSGSKGTRELVVLNRSQWNRQVIECPEEKIPSTVGFCSPDGKEDGGPRFTNLGQIAGQAAW
jgi:hypothetical protein